MSPRELRFRACVRAAGVWLWARRNWPALLTVASIVALLTLIVALMLDGVGELRGIWLGGMCIAGNCGGQP